MIERETLGRQIKEHRIKEFIVGFLRGAGVSDVEVKRTPLGEKILVHSSRPGMVVGRSGKNIKELTEKLRDEFELENPQIEISEVIAQELDAAIVAERIATSLERYGPNKFKSIIHKAVESTMAAGALGVEVLVTGKIPSARSRRWRVSTGYLKKCGEPAIQNVDISYNTAMIKSGAVGIIVKIMPPGIMLPDAVKVIKATQAENPAEPAKPAEPAEPEPEPKAESGEIKKPKASKKKQAKPIETAEPVKQSEQSEQSEHTEASVAEKQAMDEAQIENSNEQASPKEPESVVLAEEKAEAQEAAPKAVEEDIK
jgi:small subunit ribosomal protein S3